jgi:hypothetical protein
VGGWQRSFGQWLEVHNAQNIIDARRYGAARLKGLAPSDSRSHSQERE